jgi:hypothetical protein
MPRPQPPKPEPTPPSLESPAGEQLAQRRHDDVDELEAQANPATRGLTRPAPKPAHFEAQTNPATLAQINEARAGLRLPPLDTIPTPCEWIDPPRRYEYHYEYHYQPALDPIRRRLEPGSLAQINAARASFDLPPLDGLDRPHFTDAQRQADAHATWLFFLGRADATADPRHLPSAIDPDERALFERAGFVHRGDFACLAIYTADARRRLAQAAREAAAQAIDPRVTVPGTDRSAEAHDEARRLFDGLHGGIDADRIRQLAFQSGVRLGLQSRTRTHQHDAAWATFEDHPDPVMLDADPSPPASADASPEAAFVEWYGQGWRDAVELDELKPPEDATPEEARAWRAGNKDARLASDLAEEYTPRMLDDAARATFSAWSRTR